MRLLSAALLLNLALTSLSFGASLHDDFFNETITDEQYLSKLQSENSELSKVVDIPKTETPSLFSKKGVIANFKYVAKNYKGEHDIQYYIPKSLDLSKPQPVMLLLHGGGASTATYNAASSTAKMYVDSMKFMADQLNFIIIAPSSQYGWGYVVRVLLRELIALSKKDLNIDTNRILLYGHSMGAMGIVRDGAYMSDYLLGTLAAASGPADNYIIETYLNTYFNTPHLQLNGKNDHFEGFAIQSKKVEKMVGELEIKHNQKSQYRLFFHNGSHNPEPKREVVEIENFFNNPRNLYQKKIYGIVENLNHGVNQWKIPPVKDFLVTTGFWVEGLDIERGEASTTKKLIATVGSNEIAITADAEIKKIRVYLSNKMISFEEKIVINVNGETKFEDFVQVDALKAVMAARHKKDPNFIFDNFVDITL